MTPREFHARVQCAGGPDGRLRLPEMAGWETFAFETAGLQVLRADRAPQPGARPAGFGQLRGTCMAVWDDVLPPVPASQQAADAAAVARALAGSYGGTAAGS